MIGTGTLVNVAAIIIGGLIGFFSGNILKPHIKDGLMKANALAVIFVGISGTLQEMLVINEGKVETQGTLMMIVSLCVGTVIGEIIDIDGKFEAFGEWLKKVSGNKNDSQFVNGFVNASLTVCIGAMAIVGALQDGMYSNPSTLYLKAVLDFTIILIMTTSLGKGCVFSAVPVFLFQGSITLLASLIAPWMNETALSNISLVGNTLIFCVGVNLIREDTFHVGNMLPAILIAVIFAFF